MLIWADFPDDQRGLYGVRDSILTNGIYAFEQTELVSDPDPLTDGLVPQMIGTPNDTWRFARPLGATPTVGIGFNLWMNSLPSNDNTERCLMIWRSAANTDLANLSVDPTGRLKMVIAGGSTYYSTVPVITANGYYHLEGKYTHETGAFCSFEVRVEGVTKIQETNVAGTNSDVGIVAHRFAGSGSNTPGVYHKNLVIWDATGGQFNDFQGSVQVHDLYVDEDVTLGGWTTSSGASGWPLIQDAVPSNTLTLSGAISVGSDQVSMDGIHYRWVAGSVDAGTPAGTNANPWLVAHGGSDTQALANLMAAVNASGAPGTTYSTALTQNANIKAVGSTDIVLDIESRNGVTSNYACTDNNTRMSWLDTSTMVGGPTDSSFIAASNAPPAASEFKFTPLPADVTSVRGLISIIRARKTDGGDAKLQVSLSTNAVNYALGADRNLTTAPTWYWDVSVLDAATGNAYLPTAVDLLRARVNRTI